MSERDAIVAIIEGVLQDQSDNLWDWLEGGGGWKGGRAAAFAIADAIERGDHLPASVADRYRDSDIATHAAEVERLREALEKIATMSPRANEYVMQGIARQALESSR